MNIRILGLGCLVVVSAVLVSACASSNTQGETGLKYGSAGPLAFIDLEVFDSQLSQNLQKYPSRVTVTFPNQAVNVNDMPDRLQPWLTAVHKHGGGISVETREGYVRKDLFSVMGILASGYKVIKRLVPTVLSQQYRAVIVVGDGQGTIEKVDFIRL